MTRKDVLIIGAGVAGASAAFHLATAGRKVALIEKENEHTFNRCGGGMASVVQKWFPFDLKPIVDEVITRVEFSWNLSDQVIAELKGKSPFWIVKREELDNFITNKAVEAGAELIKPFNVQEITQEEDTWIVSSKGERDIKGKSIVIADGSMSPWSKQFNLGPKKQHYASTISIRLKERGNLSKGTSRFEFGLVPGGFSWAFPLMGGINVGAGTFIGTNNLNLEHVISKMLIDLGINPIDKKEAIQTSKLRVWNGHSDIHGNGIIAVGDAASLCDPFLAEGLRPSIMSGYEGAKAIDNWLRGESRDLSQYSKRMKSNWGNSMVWGKRISQIFYRLPRIGYQLGVKRPTAPERISQILSGEMSYEDISQRVIKRLLFKTK